MTAKEYLQEIRKLDLYINQKQTEYDTLYKLRGGAGGIDYAQERVQTSPDGQGFTKISDRLIDLQKEINGSKMLRNTNVSEYIKEMLEKMKSERVADVQENHTIGQM